MRFRLLATVLDRRVSGVMTAVSSSVAWLASWKAPRPSMSTGTSPVMTSTGEASVLAAATAVAMLQEPGPPMPERRTEGAAGTGIAVGHVDRTALVRRDHRL